MSGGWPEKPNLEWREGLIWCCDTLGYVTPSDRWDHVEESTEAMIADSARRRAAANATEAADGAAPIGDRGEGRRSRDDV